MRGLFFDAQDPVSSYFSDSETLGIGNFLQQDSGTPGLPGKVVQCAADVSLDDVVAKDYANSVAASKVFSQAQRIGNSSFSLLIGIVDILQSELFPVREESKEVTGIITPRHDQYFAYAGLNEGPERIVDHGLVVYGQEMLVR